MGLLYLYLYLYYSINKKSIILGKNSIYPVYYNG
jgi:hypothetical protein